MEIMIGSSSYNLIVGILVGSALHVLHHFAG